MNETHVTNEWRLANPRISSPPCNCGCRIILEPDFNHSKMDSDKKLIGQFREHHPIYDAIGEPIRNFNLK